MPAALHPASITKLLCDLMSYGLFSMQIFHVCVCVLLFLINQLCILRVIFFLKKTPSNVLGLLVFRHV